MSCLKAPASSSKRSPLLRVSHISCKRDISQCPEEPARWRSRGLEEPSPPCFACAVSPQQTPSTLGTFFSLPDKEPRIYSVPRENNLQGGHQRPRQQSPRGPEERKPHSSKGLSMMLTAHLIPVFSFSQPECCLPPASLTPATLQELSALAHWGSLGKPSCSRPYPLHSDSFPTPVC